jgi:hypothetical protein
MWRKHVRPGTFKGVQHGQFLQVWHEFETVILRPELRLTLGEIDFLQPSPLCGVIDREREFAFSFIAYGAGASSQSRPGESGQRDKWSFCLTAARMPRLRRDHDEADETEPHAGLQGEGGACGAEGREDAGRAGVVF